MRAGRLRERMHAPCSCQGGMRFVRKSPKLAGFTELCLDILQNYDEFKMPGHPKPSDDMIFPLACSVFDFPPSENWANIFCYLPESKITKLDVVHGEIDYVWTITNHRFKDAFFIHFSAISTKHWLYNREVYRMICHTKGRHPRAIVSGIIKIRCLLVQLYDSGVYRLKAFVYRLLRAVV